VRGRLRGIARSYRGGVGFKELFSEADELGEFFDRWHFPKKAAWPAVEVTDSGYISYDDGNVFSMKSDEETTELLCSRPRNGLGRSLGVEESEWWRQKLEVLLKLGSFPQRGSRRISTWSVLIRLHCKTESSQAL
jgi:hypothetical protein